MKRRKQKWLCGLLAASLCLLQSAVLAAVPERGDGFNRDIPEITAANRETTFIGGELFNTKDDTKIVDPFATEDNYRYLKSEGGAGKAEGDNFLKYYAPFYESSKSNGDNTTEVWKVLNAEASTGKYVILSAQIRLENLNSQFEFTLKADDSWNSLFVFGTNGELRFVNAKNNPISPYKYQAKQWYHVTAVFEQGSDVVDLYVNGEQQAVVDGVSQCNIAKPFNKVNTIDLKQMGTLVKNSPGIDYIDNVRIYESDTPYAAQGADLSLTLNNKYSVQDNVIWADLEGTTAQGLLGDAKVAEGSSVRLYKADDKTVVSEGALEEGTNLYVIAKDGINMRRYEVKQIQQIKNLHEDNFNRTITRIDKDSSLVYTNDTKNEGFYKDLQSSMFDGVYYHVGNKSALKDEDFVDIMTGAGKKADDSYLVIHSDTFKTTTETGEPADTNKFVELYKGANTAMDANYNTVFEFSFRVEDFNINRGLDLKLNDKWQNAVLNITTNQEIEVGGKKQKIEARNWYHVAYIFHKNSKVFDIYVNGEMMAGGVVLNADDGKTAVEKFSTLTMKMQKDTGNRQASTLYLDNLRWYNMFGDYNVAKADVSIAAPAYRVAGNKIINVPKLTPVESFKNNVSVASNSTWKLYEADEKTEVTSGTVKSGMKAVVYAEDGITLKIYEIKTENGIAAKFYKNEVAPENQIQKIEGNKIIAQVTLTNDSEASDTNAVVIALYKDGRLDDIAVSQPVTVSAGQISAPVELSVEGISEQELDKYSVKVFAWDSMTNASPMGAALVLGQ